MTKFLEQLLSKIKTADETFQPVNPDDPDSPMVRLHHREEKFSDLERFREQPRRIEGERTFTELEAFCAYIKHFKIPKELDNKFGKTAVFINTVGESFTCHCVLDYHSAPDSASHATHEIGLTHRYDVTYEAFLDNDNTWFTHRNAAQFFKQYSNAIAESDRLAVLESVANVKAETQQEESVESRRHGRSKKTFFKILDDFFIVVKPFQSLPFVYELKCELSAQYDSDDNLRIRYTIMNKHKVIEAVVKDLKNRLDEFKEDILIF
jgi:uncharacterized protein YfdQ (DUF2303 family)